MTTPTTEGKVSIIVPCFNDGAMLREALASVEKVRNENLLEVIVVDDGSSEAETIGFLMNSRRWATALWLSPTVVPVLPGTRAYDWLKVNLFCRWTAIISFEMSI